MCKTRQLDRDHDSLARRQSDRFEQRRPRVISLLPFQLERFYGVPRVLGDRHDRARFGPSDPAVEEKRDLAGVGYRTEVQRQAVPLSQPHPMLAKLLQVSSPGQLWPPKQLEGWWIVVRLEELHCTELNNSLKQRLLLELGEKHLEQQLSAATPTSQN